MNATNAPACGSNQRALAGLRASEVVHLHGARFSVYAVHTRFDAVQWFAVDARLLLIPDETAVVAQCDTFEECVAKVEVRVAREVQS